MKKNHLISPASSLTSLGPCKLRLIWHAPCSLVRLRLDGSIGNKAGHSIARHPPVASTCEKNDVTNTRKKRPRMQMSANFTQNPKQKERAPGEATDLACTGLAPEKGH